MGTLQDDLDRNYPSSQIDILAVNEVGRESANGVAAAINDLPLLQDVDANGDNASDAWDAWAVTYRDVRVVDAQGELTDVLNLTQHDLRASSNYERLRNMIVDAATSNRVAASPWQNRIEPLDVNNDGNVVPNDVLRVINRINTDGPGELPAPQGEPANFYDVTGDNNVTSHDALRIIQVLNRLSRANGEPPDEVTVAVSDVDAVAADAYFQLSVVDDAGEDDE